MQLVEFDHDRYSAVVGGKRVRFTPAEYHTVTFLAAHPGFVRSRVQIADAYSDNAFINDTSVNTVIKRIRQKLRSIGVDPIETRYGFGYSWNEAIRTQQFLAQSSTPQSV